VTVVFSVQSRKQLLETDGELTVESLITVHRDKFTARRIIIQTERERSTDCTPVASRLQQLTDVDSMPVARRSARCINYPEVITDRRKRDRETGRREERSEVDKYNKLGVGRDERCSSIVSGNATASSAMHAISRTVVVYKVRSCFGLSCLIVIRSKPTLSPSGRLH